MRKAGLGNQINRMSVFLFLIAVCAYMPSARYTDGIISLVMFIQLFCITFFRLIKSRYRLKLDKNIKWYFIFVIYAILSCVWSVDDTQILLYMTNSFPIIFGGVVMISAYVDSEEDVDTLFQLIIWAGVYAAIRFTLYTPWKSILSTGYYIRGMFASLLDSVTNYNSYSTHIAFISIIALYYIIIKKEKKYYFAFAIMFIMQLLSGSRKNILIIPCIALFFVFSQTNFKKVFKYVVILLMFLILSIWAFSNLEFLSLYKRVFIELLDSLFNSSTGIIDTSTSERNYLMQTAKEVWLSSPLFGVGWENFAIYNKLNLLAHNNYLEILASLGLVGFCIYYYNYIRIFFKTIGKKKSTCSLGVDKLMQGFLLTLLIFEYGSVTMNSRERMIVVLLVFMGYSFMKKEKITNIKFSV